LLAKCLLASINQDFSLALLNCIPQEYQNDGNYMLWAITNNIYRNNVAFVENIWEKIITTMIAHHDNNVERYLIFIKNNLQMIHSKSTAAKKHNGLITYILRQLKLSTNPCFFASSKIYTFNIKRPN